MIEIVDLKKKFQDHWITNGVDLVIPKGKITCIVGKSGEGKSVLLKQIIGLIKPTSGTIFLDGIDITHLDDEEIKAVFRKCGYVFQFAALLDSLTVFENIALALNEREMTMEEMQKIAIAKLALVNLGPEVLTRYPCELSGGMKKRVGIARTLVNEPSVIFYDEPTSGLDPINARIIHELIRSMTMLSGATSIVVSHDIEIFKYVDYIALLHEGTIKFYGPSESVWQSDNPYIYQFIRGLSHGPIYVDPSKPSQLLS